MPLEILLPLVVFGIAAIAGTLHGLGLSKAKQLSPYDLLAEWGRHFPSDTFTSKEIGDVLVNAGKDRGLVHSDQGHGLIWTMGADTAARRLQDFEIKPWKKGLTLHLGDPGAPRIRLRLSNAEQLIWTAYLEKINEH